MNITTSGHNLFGLILRGEGLGKVEQLLHRPLICGVFSILHSKYLPFLTDQKVRGELVFSSGRVECGQLPLPFYKINHRRSYHLRKHACDVPGEAIGKPTALLCAERLVKLLRRVGNAREWEVVRVLLEFLWRRVEEDNLRNTR